MGRNSKKQRNQIKALTAVIIIAAVFLAGFGVKTQARDITRVPIEWSEEELAYINQQKEIRLVNFVTRAPLSYKEDGELQGISVDIMKWIESNTGLHFTYLELPTGANPIEYITQGNAEVAVGVFRYGENLSNPNIMLTDAFFASDVVLVARKGAAIDMGEQLKVLVNKGYRMGYQFLKDNYPNYEVEYADSTEEALKAVQRGKADLMFQSVYIIDEYLKRPSYSDLMLYKSSVVQEELACAVVADGNQMLVDILNKAIAAVPEEYTRQLIVDYTITRMYYPTISEQIANNPVLFIELGIIVFAIVLVLALFIRLRNHGRVMRILTANEEMLEEEKEMYRLFMEDSKDIVFYCDIKTHAYTWPPFYEERFGIVPPQFVYDGKEDETFRTIIEDEDVPLFIRTIEELKNTRKRAETSVRLKTVDGSRWHRIKLSCMEKNGKVYRMLGKMTDIDKEVNKMQQLSDASMRDKLTGLYNKNAFYTLVNKYIEDAGKRAVLLFFDLDNFKSVNDQMGHLAGDGILTNVAGSMKRIFRSDDIVARFGGDEFIIFVKDSDETVALGKVQSLRDEIMKIKQECHAQDTGLSACIGVSCYPGDAQNVEQLVEKADEAMYYVKQHGKNGYAFYRDVKN